MWFQSGTVLWFRSGTVLWFRSGTVLRFRSGTVLWFRSGTVLWFRSGTVLRFRSGTVSWFRSATEAASAVVNYYPGSNGVVVPGEGVERSELLPARAQLLRSVTEETTDVRSNLERYSGTPLKEPLLKNTPEVWTPLNEVIL